MAYTSKSTLFLYRYNNYYNRKLSVDDLPINALKTLQEVTFNPNDGINTYHIVSYPSTCAIFPDYLVETHIEEYDDNSRSNVSTRWFIIESKRERNGIYNLSLRRDVLYDFADERLFPNGDWRSAPAYIERAIAHENSPFVFNKEAITFNQIKKDEFAITDDTDECWFVGYVTKNTSAEDPLSSTKITIDVNAELYDPLDYANISELPFPVNTAIKVPSTYNYVVRATGDQNGALATRNYRISPSGYTSADWFVFGLQTESKILENSSTLSASTIAAGGEALYQAYDWNVVNNYIVNEQGYSTSTSFLNYKDRTIQVAGEYYAVRISTSTFSEGHDAINNGALQMYIVNGIPTAYFHKVPNISGQAPNTMSYYVQGTQYKITLEAISAPIETYTIGGETGFNTKRRANAVYDMFCVQALDSKRETLKYIMGDLIRQLGAKVYDIQLLPFCPIRSSAERVNNNFAENILDSNGDTYERIIWCADVSGTYVCSADGLLSTTTGQRLSSTIQNKKIENETMFYRLCSPSYGSSYDYSNAKNEGTDYFIVDYYCKPINPYIHVAPHFKGLYGQSFGDARGLVCNENFSISQVSDAWINYELQNKNYQKIFNREIASMDKQIGWGIAESAIGAVAGTGQGAISGTMTGALTGGPVGAVAGAVTGGALSGVGGVLDVIKTVDLSLDNRDKAIAIHNMQLQNIRALPYSLSNVDSFTPNNKIFPIVEVYDCTAEEKTNLARYIAFNSMTINAYGTIEQYMSNQWSYQGIKSKGWIKARLLLTDYQNNNETAYLGDDAHIATAIAEELSKGVFIQ